MLLPAAQVTSLATMSANDISAALDRNGYTGDKVLTAVFVGVNSMTCSFIYDCTYNDDETGKVEDCRVYAHMTKLQYIVADY